MTLSAPIPMLILLSAVAALWPLHALRRGEDPDGGSAAQSMLAAVQSLQQSAQETEAGFTPGLASAIDALLVRLDAMRMAVKEHHEATQKTLNEKFGSLDSVASVAVELKSSANIADKAWVDCVAEDKSALQEVEAAQAEVDQTTPVKEHECQRAENISEFAVSLHGTTLTCNQSHHYCPDIYSEWQNGISTSVSKVRQVIETANTNYRDAKQKCTDATALLANQSETLSTKQGVWSEKRLECHDLDGARKVEVCDFGMRLQQKCSSEADYQHLLQELNQQNNTYSEQDLRAEWETIHTIECMLTALKTEGKVVGTEECQNSGASYEVAVGILDTQAANLSTLVDSNVTWCTRLARIVSGPLDFVEKDEKHILGYGANAASVELTKAYLSGSLTEEHLTDAGVFRKTDASSAADARWLACAVESQQLKVTEVAVTVNQGELQIHLIDAFYQENDGTATCSPAEVNEQIASGQMKTTYASHEFYSYGFGIVGLVYSAIGSVTLDDFVPKADCSGSEGALLGLGDDARLTELVSATMVTEKGKTALAFLHRRTGHRFQASAQTERWLAAFYGKLAGDYAYRVRIVQLEVAAVGGKVYLSVVSAHEAAITFKTSYTQKHGDTVTAERANAVMDSGAMDDVEILAAIPETPQSFSLFPISVRDVAYKMSSKEGTVEGLMPVGCAVGAGKLLGPGSDARLVDIKHGVIGGKDLTGYKTATVFQRTGSSSSTALAKRWLFCYVQSGYYSQLDIAEVEVQATQGSLYAVVVGSYSASFQNMELTKANVNNVMDSDGKTAVSVATWTKEDGVGVVSLRAELKGAERRESITFSDVNWTFPHYGGSNQVSSGEYLRTTPYAMAFNATMVAKPFELCHR